MTVRTEESFHQEALGYYRENVVDAVDRALLSFGSLRTKDPAVRHNLRMSILGQLSYCLDIRVGREAEAVMADLRRLGQGSIFQFGERGPDVEFAWRIPQPDGHPLVFCSCPDFRCDDACQHIDAMAEAGDD